MDTQLKEGMPVLVRDNVNERWKYSIFVFYDNSDNSMFPYECVGETSYKYCIPYTNETKHLCSTSKSIEDSFKLGSIVEVRNNDNDDWKEAIYLGEETSTAKFFSKANTETIKYRVLMCDGITCYNQCRNISIIGKRYG